MNVSKGFMVRFLEGQLGGCLGGVTGTAVLKLSLDGHNAHQLLNKESNGALIGLVLNQNNWTRLLILLKKICEMRFRTSTNLIRTKWRAMCH